MKRAFPMVKQITIKNQITGIWLRSEKKYSLTMIGSSFSPVSLMIISTSWFSPSTLFRNLDPDDFVIGIVNGVSTFLDMDV